jgi:ABC-2 type transport system ATP-binding protein
MTHGNEQIIKVDSLYKHFNEVKAVNGISFSVDKGDVYGFLGPNGSGKSTTIRMLLSLIRPDSGIIEIFGRELSGHKHKILSGIGALIEKPDFYEYLSAEKNLWLLARYGGFDIPSARISEVLEMVGLSERANSKVKTYSKGMKQRLGIAQAILHDPDLIILDEPGSGLDPSGIKDIRELIFHLNRDLGKTIFLLNIDAVNRHGRIGDRSGYVPAGAVGWSKKEGIGNGIPNPRKKGRGPVTNPLFSTAIFLRAFILCFASS